MSPASPARKEPELPTIGRYEIHDEIGRGSTGVVYLAHDPLIGRWVALKTLSREFSPDEERIAALRRQLFNEAQSAGGLSHAGIVAIYDVVEHGEGRLSIAGEYVEGGDLARRLAEPEPLALEFAGKVLTEVAAALDYAHSRGVVHRDLKPASILIGADGAVKVTDFGIASLRDRDLADELKNLGSPNYLAPERILGQEAEARSDVYALGVVLYEMLTRNPPFSGGSVAELARNIVQRRPAPVDHYRPDVFPEIVDLLDTALAKEPAERYQTAGELAADFRRALEKRSSHSDTVPTPVLEELDLTIVEPVECGESVESLGEDPSPEPAQQRPEPPGKKHRPYLVFLPVFFGLALAAGVFFGGRPAAELPVTAAAETEPADTDQIEYLRLLAESRQLFAEGDREAARLLLDQAERLSPAGADRVRRMRDNARSEARAERVALAEAEALDLLDQAQTDVEAWRLRSAEAKVSRALELSPDSEEALRLRDEIARQRARWLARQRARQAAVPVAEETAPAKEESQPFTPPVQETRAIPAAPGRGDLRIDFYSEKPRGVLTVYVGRQQIFNRPFRFFEKMSLLRRRGVAGGFDERVRIPAGTLGLRIYLTLPDEKTQLRTLAGTAPAGSLRTLRVRVAGDGDLTAELH